MSFPKLSEIKPGDKLIADGGFTCLDEDEVVEVAKDEEGFLYVPCRDGQHHLDGQEGENGEVIGLRRAP